MRLDQYQGINNKSIYNLRINIFLVMSDNCVDNPQCGPGCIYSI